MADTKPVNLMDKIVALCKRRGFVFQSSEIYGGINGFWDYGPMGAELKRNVRDAWWNDTVRRRPDVVGIDGTIITHPRVWEASGHVTSFSDPMVDCKKCKGRWRADQLPETKCPEGGPHDYTEARQFNLMFESHAGPVKDDSNKVYLRPETAQVIFVQFQNVLSVSRQKIPFGIAQIGKAFRNEINPRNFTFRSREFEQMELEFFIKPGTDADWHQKWVAERLKWYETIGLPKEKLSVYEYKKEELAHYASACVDVMFAFPFGVQELEGIAARGNFDLSQHQKFSGKSMEYFDDETKEKYIPHVVEPSAGVDRICLALLCAAYTEEEVAPGDIRIVMKFAPRIAPVKVAVFPLLRNKPPLVEKAKQVFELLQSHFTTEWDDRGNIGKRYRYQDEQGTPWCVTVDFDTLGEKGSELLDTVTIRDRDTMKQERVKIADLIPLITGKLRGGQ
ncbi:MAG: glycine--tRNA ligase [Verrucomicrobiota bacterium]|jgi:glycyl-tRNA synthetase